MYTICLSDHPYIIITRSSATAKSTARPSWRVGVLYDIIVIIDKVLIKVTLNKVITGAL